VQRRRRHSTKAVRKWPLAFCKGGTEISECSMTRLMGGGVVTAFLGIAKRLLCPI
jgi:hypothetical protein